jgi:DNA-binding NtrC family response regulator
VRAKAWCRFVPEELAAGHASILDSLEKSGLIILPGDEDFAAPGAVFFEDACADLHALLAAARDERGPALAVCLRAAGLTPTAAWQLLRAGASDVLEWNGESDAVSARLRRWAEVGGLLESNPVRSNLIGRSPAWINLLRQLVDTAWFSTAPCLLLGESGTGKELAARLVHTLDRRPGKRDLVVVDCSTVVPELSGSEFFGHERGAYTGALHVREGAFALANGGTLFLDETGDLPLPLQA